MSVDIEDLYLEIFLNSSAMYLKNDSLKGIICGNIDIKEHFIPEFLNFRLLSLIPISLLSFVEKIMKFLGE